MTIDAYCLHNNISTIDYLKIDVEGHEFKVLQGAQRLLGSRAIRYVQFEFNSCAIFERVFLKDIFDMLLKQGYTVYKITPQGLILIENWNWCLETLGQSNYLGTTAPIPAPLCVGKAMFNKGWYIGCCRQ